MDKVTKYNKAIVAFIGFAAVVLVEAGLMGPGTGQLFTQLVIQLLTLFGIVLVPNRDYDGKW